jgi:hypothetical protein
MQREWRPRTGYTGVSGYQDAGIHVAGIPPDGNVRVKGKRTTVVVGTLCGVIIEDVSDQPGGKRGVRLEKMVLVSNSTGILLHDADEIVIQRNVVNDGRGSGTAVGIEVDGGSDDNLIKSNTFVDATTDVVEAAAATARSPTRWKRARCPPAAATTEAGSARGRRRGGGRDPHDGPSNRNSRTVVTRARGRSKCTMWPAPSIAT